MKTTLRLGDCLEWMELMATNSVDSIVTDPPYGLSFMGKKWDHGVPSSEIWAECLRVLKPGGHLLAFGGTRTQHRLVCAIEDAGFDIRDQIAWVYGSGFPKSLNGQWGGTALKPAIEPICLARKPITGTVAANVLAHGTGGLNIDGCRVESGGEHMRGEIKSRNKGGWAESKGMHTPGRGFVATDSPLGRWPANLIHDGSSEVLATFPIAPGQQADASSSAPSPKTNGIYGAMKRIGEPSQDSNNVGTVGFKMKPGARRIDSGSAARFFYCAKARKSDRGIMNDHPTVKPTNLMRYLCRLVTPPGGTVLDPFMGSGSTGRAAWLEGMNFVGIELDPAYMTIAKRRINELVLDL